MKFQSVAVYMALGIFSDVLVTAWTYCAAHRWALSASLLSIPIAMVNFGVFSNVAGQKVKVKKWTAVLAYALGSALGCFLCLMAMPK